MGKSKEWGVAKPPPMSDRVHRVVLALRRVNEIERMLTRAKASSERGLESLSQNERAQLDVILGRASSVPVARAKATKKQKEGHDATVG